MSNKKKHFFYLGILSVLFLSACEETGSPMGVDPNTIVLSKYQANISVLPPYERQDCFWDNAVQTCQSYYVDDQGHIGYYNDDDQPILTDARGGILSIGFSSEEMRIDTSSYYEQVPDIFGGGVQWYTDYDTLYIDVNGSAIFASPAYELPETIQMGGQWNANYSASLITHTSKGDLPSGSLNISISVTATTYPGGLSIGNTTFEDVILLATTRTDVWLDKEGSETKHETTALQSYYALNVGLVKQEGLVGTKAVSKILGNINVGGNVFFAP